MNLARLNPLGRADVAFHSLQVGSSARQAGDPALDIRAIDHAAALTDFAQTAGLIANLDLVICVDTAVAHLAGAMGRPVWMMFAFDPDWRWRLDRADSSWYPTMRLFRQNSPGDWDGVVARVKSALGEFVARFTQRGSH